jgi:hypothetical protein
MGHLFTPRISSKSNERLRMSISDTDYLKVERGHPWRAEVVDLNSNKRYLVRGAACGAPRCRCDAVIVKMLT